MLRRNFIPIERRASVSAKSDCRSCDVTAAVTQRGTESFDSPQTTVISWQTVCVWAESKTRWTRGDLAERPDSFFPHRKHVTAGVCLYVSAPLIIVIQGALCWSWWMNAQCSNRTKRPQEEQRTEVFTQKNVYYEYLGHLTACCVVFNANKTTRKTRDWADVCGLRCGPRVLLHSFLITDLLSCHDFVTRWGGRGTFHTVPNYARQAADALSVTLCHEIWIWFRNVKTCVINVKYLWKCKKQKTKQKRGCSWGEGGAKATVCSCHWMTRGQ